MLSCVEYEKHITSGPGRESNMAEFFVQYVIGTLVLSYIMKKSEAILGHSDRLKK